ncbi:MAG: hypothetical protein ABI364_01805 [Caldimonas sp.]
MQTVTSGNWSIRWDGREPAHGSMDQLGNITRLMTWMAPFD